MSVDFLVRSNDAVAVVTFNDIPFLKGAALIDVFIMELQIVKKIASVAVLGMILGMFSGSN